MVPISNPDYRRSTSLPAVHVITVCRNALADLRLTATSVASQGYSSLTWHVQDGNSTDGTQEFLGGLSLSNLHWESETDGGIYDAMNKAVTAAPFDGWIIFLNAGDAFASNGVLERLLPALTSSARFIFGGVKVRSADGTAKYYPVRRDHRLGMPGCHQATLVRASVMRAERFDTSYSVGADFEFFLRASHSSNDFFYIDDVIAEIAPEGFSAANEGLLCADYSRALLLHVGRLAATEWLIRRRARRIGLRMLAMLRAWGAR